MRNGRMRIGIGRMRIGIGIGRMRMGVRVALTAALVTIHAAPLVAQSTARFVPEPARGQPFELSIANIMRAEEHVGVAPGQVRWTDDGEWVYFRWRPGGEAWHEDPVLHRVRADGTGLESLDDMAAWEASALLAGGDASPDGRWRVSSVAGDLHLVDRRTMAVRRLTQTEDGEGSPLFTEDGSAVLFRRGNDLYRFGLASGSLEQLTDIEVGPAPDEDSRAEGQKGYLEEQQRELFEHIRRNSADEARRDSLLEARSEGEPETVYLDRGERVTALTPTRDGRYALIRTTKPAQETKGTVVPDWVTDDGYTRDLNVRTKVGDAQGTSRVGVLTVATGSVSWTRGTATDDEDDPPATFNAGWNDAGTVVFLFQVSRDNKDRWIYSVDAETGATTLLDHLHDDAWVAGPCFSGCVDFLPGTDRLYFVSEASGYAHLYAIDADGSDRQTLTSGEWEVLDADIPEGGDRFLLRTNEGSPFNEHMWWMDFDGSDREAITSGTGRFVGTPAPDGERFAWVHDRANRPPELFVSDADNVDDRVQVTSSPTDEWSSFPWIEPEIVRFRADDGTMVPARIYRPRDMGARANGAGVIFVHGAGYLHNIHNYWSSYYREYQFNQFLAAAGYTVLDIDYRGSAGYGAEWRTAIYRWMGGKDLSDQVDGARYLVANEGVDTERVGLYGGSYGGFITLMGLFTAGETFKSGAALRSVTDWAHYNHGYTSRILNQPQDDNEAYDRSSPIYFAENFGPDQHLVMLHGMVDTNVHFSDVVRLSQRLIELGKENWELAVYPVESHGFVEPSSWTDEYRRIFEIFERTLREPGCTDDGDLCSVRQSR